MGVRRDTYPVYRQAICAGYQQRGRAMLGVIRPQEWSFCCVMDGTPEKPTESAAFEQAWRKRFAKFAESNDDDAGIAGWSATGLEARLKRFSRLLEGRAIRGLWLDVGCGAGTYCRLLAAAGAETVAIDYSLLTLRKARQRSPTIRQWCVGDANRLPLRREIFDGVLCFGVTQALVGSEQAVRELAGSLKAGGQIWIDGLNTWCLASLVDRLSRRLRGKPMHLRYESPRRLQVLLSNAGLVKARIFWVPIFPGRLRLLQSMVDNPVARAVFAVAWPLGAFLSHAFIVYAEKPPETVGS